ncbi:MAG: HGGxSTG domain-containing protein [Acidobacteriota bacterium]
MASCGAKTRSGGKCKRAGLTNGRCKLHGGASLVGPAHPNFRTGRHSKYLQLQFSERYQQGLNDPRLLGLRDDVALIDVRISELLEAVGETGNTRLWKDARAKFDAFKGAADKGKDGIGAARVMLDALDKVLTDGLSRASTWDELADRLDLRRRLVDSETKRQKDLFEMITTDQAMRIVGQFIDEVKQRVKDPELLTALSNHFSRLAPRGTG